MGELSALFDKKFGTEEVVELKQKERLPVPESYDDAFQELQLNGLPRCRDEVAGEGQAATTVCPM